MAISCAKASGITMRIAVFLNLCIGIALIVFGCSVQNPPKDFAPIMFVILGCLNLFSCLLGFWGSYHKKRVLLGFMVCGGFSLLLQIGLLLALLFAFDDLLEAIVPKETTPQDKLDRVAHQLNLSRWVLMGFIGLEVFTLVMAILLRFVIKEEQPYDAFREDTAAERTNTLAGLAKDIRKGVKNMSDNAYDKLRNKMAAKYGSAAADPNDWRSKTTLSWSAKV